MPPHLFVVARGSKRDFSERGTQGLVLSVGAGAERTCRKVVERTKQRVRVERSVPDALKDIVSDWLGQARIRKGAIRERKDRVTRKPRHDEEAHIFITNRGGVGVPKKQAQHTPLRWMADPKAYVVGLLMEGKGFVR